MSVDLSKPQTPSPLLDTRRRFAMWRNWLVRLGSYAIVGGIIGMVTGVTHYFLVPPQYEAQALVFVVPTPATAQERDFASLTQIRWSQAIARLAPLPEVSGNALRSAGLSDIADKPKTYISTSAAPDSAVFSVTVRSTSPEEARQAATIVGEATKKLSAQRRLPVTTNTVPATLPTTPGPRLFTRLVLAASAGVAAGALLFLVRLDRSQTGSAD